MPTMAWEKSATPSWRIVALSNPPGPRALGQIRPLMHRLRITIDPHHAVPELHQELATAPPKRPRPITTTPSPFEKANCSVIA